MRVPGKESARELLEATYSKQQMGGNVGIELRRAACVHERHNRGPKSMANQRRPRQETNVPPKPVAFSCISFLLALVYFRVHRAPPHKAAAAISLSRVKFFHYEDN